MSSIRPINDLASLRLKMSTQFIANQVLEDLKLNNFLGFKN